MGKIGRPLKEEKDKKIKYGISIDKYLFDKMKNEEKFDIISITCMTIAISFVTNFFYYILHPKKNYMLQYLQTKEQTDNWLVVYKEMQKYYYTGLFLGIIGVGVVSVAFRC